MKHSAADFARAEFARHPVTGRKALRRDNVNTEHPWIFHTDIGVSRWGDLDMAKGGWEPVETTAPAEPPEPLKIQSPLQLAGLAISYGLSDDWHEPDNQGIDARIIGTHLDNAMGSSTHFEGKDHCEFNVVLTRRREGNYGPETEDVAVVNLAKLLSWAAGRGGAQR